LLPASVFVAALPEQPAPQETSASARAAPEWSNSTSLEVPQPDPPEHFALALPRRESSPPVTAAAGRAC
jgi:hypothetical protein